MSYRWKTRSDGLYRWLILFFCLSAVTFPVTLAAPSTKRSVAMMSNGLEKWKRPCGARVEPGVLQMGDFQTSIEHTRRQIKSILIQRQIAWNHVNKFKDEYIEETLKINWNTYRDLNSNAKYDWLPDIPKQLGETLDREHLDSLELSETLYNTYKYLQMIAVCLNQISLEGDRSIHVKEFKYMENVLMNLLCSIQEAITSRGLPLREDVESSIMPDNLKNLDNTGTAHRNFIIIRDYANLLEYIGSCFDHLKPKL